MRITSLGNILCASLLFGSAAVHAQATTNQLLDRVFVYGQDRVIEMPSGSAAGMKEFDSSKEFNLSTCKLTSLDGLYCLNGTKLLHWNGKGSSNEILDCGAYGDGPALGLDTRRDNACTGMTVDYDGTIWLAGKSKGKAHVLIRLVPLPAGSGICPDANPGEERLTVNAIGGGLCAYETATGRPLLVDLATISGKAAANFSLPGHEAPLQALLGLEERKTAVAFLPEGEVVEIASGKADFNLAGNEKVQGLTLWQTGNPLRNQVLVTTDAGRILAWDTAGTGPAEELHTIAAPATAGANCPGGDPFFGIRASDRTGTVFVTDRQYCRLFAFKANPTTGKFELSTSTELDPMAPLGVTVAAGISLDLSDCTGACTVIPGDEPDEPKVSMSSVQLAEGSATGVTLFRIVGMPDCRYIPQTCADTLFPDDAGDAVDILLHRGVIVSLDSNNSHNAVAQRLNMTPLLPSEVTDLFPAGLPDMLLPRYMRGQEGQGFFFEAIFAASQKGVVFRDTFETKYEVASLAGDELGCQFTHGTLAWDMAATVSEKNASPVNGMHLARTTNSDCGTSRTRDGTLSIKPYNLEPTPCTFNPDPEDVWKGDCDNPVPGGPDDAVYAKMLLLFADEYRSTVNEFVCPATGSGLLITDHCVLLTDQVDNLIDKLHKCWDATKQPKESSGNQNCNAFDSQLSNLQSLLDFIELEEVDGEVADPANRVGELKARAMTMRHVFETRFMPSLPDAGFSE